MVPVMCKIKHNPPESYGDCLRACIETVFGNKPVVPHFADNNASVGEVTESLRAFLNEHNTDMFIVKSPCQTLNLTLLWAKSIVEDDPYLLMGENHVVVCKGSKIYHDPEWIKTTPPDKPLTAMFFADKNADS